MLHAIYVFRIGSMILLISYAIAHTTHYTFHELICYISNDINGGLKIRHLGVNPSSFASIFICLRLNIFVIFYKAVCVVHSKFY
jgi:hypothetical protein